MTMPTHEENKDMMDAIHQLTDQLGTEQ